MQAFGTLEYEHGVTAIDIGLYRPGLAACYLLRQGDRLAFCSERFGGQELLILRSDSLRPRVLDSQPG